MINQVLTKPENITRLEGVHWQTYQALLFDLGESSHQKLTFNRGILEIITPLPILSKQIILNFLRRRGEMGENALLREFRQTLENQS
ncbi:hypothetical protein ACN4EE_10195 [Geminocystis sp. CENA526]|uniref:hypothetical protein n=1 Tax=Geminocystis sp. CENA526 TaxID=1355871 RepID=UPI003D6EF5D8